jgi:hypothetical protein
MLLLHNEYPVIHSKSVDGNIIAVVCLVLKQR